MISIKKHLFFMFMGISVLHAMEEEQRGQKRPREEEQEGAAQPGAEFAKRQKLDAQEKLNRELYNTARHGTPEDIRRLVALGADVNAHHKFGNIDDDGSPLFAAAAGGKLANILTLIDLGAHIREKRRNAENILFVSIEYPEILEYFLKAGVPVDEPNAFNQTPLHIAARSSEVDSVRILLAHGAQADARDKRGNTPLMLFRGMKTQIIDMLIKAGANINAQNNDGQTALMLAIQGNELNKVKYLLSRGASIVIRDKQGRTAFDYVRMPFKQNTTEIKQREKIQKLLNNYREQHGAQPSGAAPQQAQAASTAHPIDQNALYNALYNALLHAAREGTPEKIMQLIQQGADINARGSDGLTPLHYVVRRSLVSIVQLLLQKNVAVDPIDSLGVTPLFYAIRQGNPDIVSMLIQKGAQVNIKTHTGWTPLMSAVSLNKPQYVSLLLQAGADPYVRNNEGHDAFYHAQGKPEILHILNNYRQQHGAPSETASHQPQAASTAHPMDQNALNAALLKAVREGTPEQVAQLIQQGADINVRGPYGMTPLHYAVSRSQVSIVQLLLQKNVDVDQKCGEETPLFYAVRQGNPDIVSMLIQKGADVNIKSRGGWTPLMAAAAENKPQYVSLLLQAGADPYIRNSRGHNVFDIAHSNHNAAMEHILNNYRQQHGAPSGAAPQQAQAASTAHPMDQNALNAALLKAVKEGTPEQIMHLIQQGADINARDAFGLTPLHYAVNRSQVAIVQLLLQKNVAVDPLDTWGETPLFFALRQGSHDIVSMLIQKGTQVNIKNRGGWTPLMTAVRFFRPQYVSLLLQAGADPDVRDAAGRDAFYYAQNYPEIAHILNNYKQQHGAQPSGAATHAAQAAPQNTVKAFLGLSASPTAAEVLGLTSEEARDASKIKSAYRKLQLLWHPDKIEHNPRFISGDLKNYPQETKIKIATEASQLFTDAYQYLQKHLQQ